MTRLIGYLCTVHVPLHLSILLCVGCGGPVRPQSSHTKAKRDNKPPAAQAPQSITKVADPQAHQSIVENSQDARPHFTTPAVPHETKSIDKPQTSLPAKPESSNRRPATTGILSGRVTLSGQPPQPRTITVTKNQDTCGLAAGKRQDVVVSAGGGLKDVVVEILGIESDGEGFAWVHPAGGYVLRQKGCQFEPSLLVMPAGEKLTVLNDDPIGHNVNSGQWNEQQPGGGEAIVRSLNGHRPVRVGCNIHSWMESWVYLARTPFYAVSDDQGQFRIENVPAGKYRVTFWHSSLRPTRQQVTIKAGQVDHHDVVFKSPVSN